MSLNFPAQPHLEPLPKPLTLGPAASLKLSLRAYFSQGCVGEYVLWLPELKFGFSRPGFLPCLMLTGLLLGHVAIAALLCLLGLVEIGPADESPTCMVAALASPSSGAELGFCCPWQDCSCLICLPLHDPLWWTSCSTGLSWCCPDQPQMCVTLSLLCTWHLNLQKGDT